MDVSRHREHISLIRQGKIDHDKLKYGAYIGEWEDIANEYADVKENGLQFRSGNVGIITSTDSPTLNSVQILGELQGVDTRNYTLEGALTQVSTPNLEISVDSIFGFTASQDVGEGMEPDVKKGKFERTKYTLKKDAGYIMQTDEAAFTNDRDTFNLGIQQVTRDLVRIFNDKIIAKLEGADVPTMAGDDWAAVASGLRTNDAVTNIAEVEAVIAGNGGILDTIVSDPIVLRAYVSNVQGGATLMNAPVGLGVVGNNRTDNVPGVNGVTWYTDNGLANTRITAFDKRAVLKMQGPVRTAQFRDERRGMDGYITRNWRGVQIIDTSRIRGVTGVL
jgi:hypothetical protein